MNRQLGTAPSAGLGRRAAAVALDLVLVLLAGGWLNVVQAVRTSSASLADEPAPTSAPGWLLAACAAGVLVVTLVQWVLHGRLGWTVGRRIVGIRTVDARTRRPIGMWRILLRGLVVALGSVVLVVGQLVVLLSPLFDHSGRRQGWHDRAARALVLDVRDGVAGPGVVPPPPPRADLVQAGTTDSWRAPSAPVPPPPAPAAPVPQPAASVPLPAASGPAPTEPRPVTRPLVLAPLAPHRAGPDLDTRAIPVVPPPPAPAPAPVAAPAAPAPHASPDPSGRGGLDEAGGLDEDVEATRRVATPAPTRDTAPGPVALAVLELGDGQRIEVRHTALVGRNPAAATDGVQLVRVVDPGRSVSKTHLQLAVEPSGVWVADRGSTNGTVVTLPDGGQVICPVDQPVRLRVGSVVVFGDCSMRLVATV